MFYCSQACQRQDWNHVHKLKECKLLSTENGRRCNSMDLDLYRLLVRLVVKTLYDEKSRNMSCQLFDGTSRCLEDLMDHVTELRCDKQRYHMLKLTAAHIIDLGVEETEDGIIRRANQIFVNAFGIQLETLERKMAAKPYEIALGFYIEGSYLDHSCKPNAAQVFVGKTMIIRALCDIDSDKQSVTDSYIDLMTPVGSRLQKLKQTYYFDCTCQRCVGDKSDSDCDTFQSLKQEYQLYNENDDYLAAYETVVHMIPIVERSLGRYSLWMSELCWMKLQFKLLDAKQKGDENVTNLHHLWLDL
ncbi:N-lysine methyltransferase SMYD2-B [Halotydeus destructor]|nr:N-lysine methyltransferase SMYD2-B [Halotydeus destructor]